MSEEICDIIGIDFGSSTICASYFKDKKFQIFPLETDRNLMPACFTMKEKEFFVGKAAENTQKQKSTKFTLFDLRRILCSEKVEFVDAPFGFNIKNFLLTVKERNYGNFENIYKFPMVRGFAVFFRWIKNKMETELNHIFKGVVLTMPLGLDLIKQQLIISAAKIAGFNIIETIYEPVAAALAYYIKFENFNEPKTICIFDFGGAKFNIANVRISENNVELLDYVNDLELGGNDVDNALYYNIKKKIEKKNKDFMDVKQCLSLREKIINIKERLSNRLEINDTFEVGDVDISINITRKEFERECQNIFDFVYTITKKFLKYSPPISDVIFIGGSTRIPYIENDLRNLLATYFPKAVINKTINPDESVAKGAAIYAAILSDLPTLKKMKILQRIRFDEQPMPKAQMDTFVNENAMIMRRVYDYFVYDLIDIKQEKEALEKLFDMNDETVEIQERLQTSSQVTEKAREMLIEFRRTHESKYNQRESYKAIITKIKHLTQPYNYNVDPLEMYEKMKIIVFLAETYYKVIDKIGIDWFYKRYSQEIESFRNEMHYLLNTDYTRINVIQLKQLKYYFEYFEQWQNNEIIIKQIRSKVPERKASLLMELQKQNGILKNQLKDFHLNDLPITFDKIYFESLMVAVGIDLGTTNSCVAVYTTNGVEILANDLGKRTTPSFVLLSGNEPVVGEAAKDTNARNIDKVVYDAKRMIGKKYSDKSFQNDMKHLKWPFEVKKDKNDLPKIYVANYKKAEILPEEISALVLAKMKKIVEENYLGGGKQLTEAVITVPAYFNDDQRGATIHAAEIAGLKVQRLISEPSAAGLAFCHQRLRKNPTSGQKIFVYDLGGGTFDVSIMQMIDGEVKVIAINGDTQLGGNDFDRKLMDFCIKKFKEKTSEDISQNAKGLWKLRSCCIKAKEHLSNKFEYEMEIDNLQNNHNFEYTLKRIELENICKDLFLSTLNIIDKTLKDAKLTAANIDEVLLVGGSSRIPKIQEMLATKFGAKKLNKTINADEAVAYGAAILAATISGEISRNCNMILMDVTPLSIGFQAKPDTCLGEIDCKCISYYYIVISKNSIIPIKITILAMTYKDDQEVCDFIILEDEHHVAEKNHTLGRLTVNGIPKNKRRMEAFTYHMN